MTDEAQALTIRARSIFPNQGMHGNAEFIAALHPRAIDYLEQAPVLAASFGVKRNTRADRLWVAMRIGGPISRGERLRNVMGSVGLATPLRKLSAVAISPTVSQFVRELSDIDPSTLSQSIPEKPGAQRAWLKSLKDWRSRLKQYGRSPKTGFQWVARHGQRCEQGQAEDFVDFIVRQSPADMDRWSFERMVNEVELWHDRLAGDKMVNGFGAAITPTTVIDISDWPDHVEMEGLEFFKLATPSMLMEEGRRMRHCVASYIPDVISGDAHIYSIRADMRRMATMDVRKGRLQQIKAHSNRLPAAYVVDAARKFIAAHDPARRPA